jgi:DNA-binding transcriptional LysR family regulator
MAILLDSIPWARRLKIRHLEVFVVLHETRSLTDAAARLHMTQPALSHWLADMENALGRALFLRDRRLTVTPDGEVLLRHAERMLGDVQRTHLELQAVEQGMQGRLHVGTGLPRVLLPGAISRLLGGRPDVFVVVTEAPQPQLLEMMCRCELDVLFAAIGTDVRQMPFSVESLVPSSIQIVARRDHPLLQGRTCRLEDTLTWPWILPPTDSVMRGAFNDAYARQGLSPPQARVVGNTSVRMQLLACGRDYLSILTAMEVRLYAPDGFALRVPVDTAISFPDIGIVWSPDRSGPIVDSFLDAAREAARAELTADG